MTAAPVYVLGAVEAVLRGDFALARWAHRQAVAARAVALFDDGADVVMPAIDRTRLDADERPRRMVGAERGGP
jgi:hypothetical protein